MIPVKDENVSIIDLESKDNYINKYSKLLKLQLYYLRENDEQLFRHSKQLYSRYIQKRLPKNIRDRCCNFKLLEEKCEEFNKQFV